MSSILAMGHSWALNALMLFDDDVPNEEAVALSPTVGWLVLGGAIALALLLILHSERWRRFWLVLEDPRAIGLYRIIFGFFVICNVNDFWEYFEFLFTDEGIFTADVARQVHASAQFVGFGDGLNDQEPWGFFDHYAFLEFLKGPKYSLLYFWDTPTFFWAHLWAFQISGVLFMIGFRTRFFGILTFFLMNSIFFRNHLFWEGTELVYRVFLAYLICAKSGYAYSVDNWLRCRKLRKKGLLSERDGPGNGAGVPPSDEHPQGLEPVYRLIPAWPRRLAILQMCALYADTGILKNGSVWAKGDAIYYAWNMDHFYRFYPQQIAALFGTNLLRISAWFSHWGEALFSVMFIGVLIKFGHEHKFPPLRGARAQLARVCWAVLIGVSAAIIWITWPVHFTPAVQREAFVGGWVAGLLGIWWLYGRLGRRPFEIRGRVGLWILWIGFTLLVDLLLWLLLFPLSHRLEMIPQKVGIMAGWTALAVALPIVIRRFLPSVLDRLRRLPMFREEFLEQRHTIDRMWLARWVVGRRIWVTWHISLMGGIFVLMNIGQFQTGMLSQTVIFFTGAEVAWFLHRVGHRLKLTKHRDPIPAQDPALPQVQRDTFQVPLSVLVAGRFKKMRRDAAHVPQWALVIALAVIVAGIMVKVHEVSSEAELGWDWRWIGIAAMAFLAGVAWWNWRANRRKTIPLEDPLTGTRNLPWAYGPFGRFITSTLLIWQIVAVATWLSPDKDSLSTWRPEARKVFAKWLTVTQTDQGWGMFAPNPPRSNVFLKVLVHTEDGEAYDLKTDVYAPERKPIPWIWNDRMRKMNRRIIGGESGPTQWYRKWYARYICRKWAMDHEGIEPDKVELVKIWYRIPSPEETWKKGWYDPEDLLERQGNEKVEHTEHCRRTVMGQLPPWIRERHDLPPLRDGWKYRPWIKHKKKKWERQLAKERGEEPEKKPARAKRADKADKVDKVDKADKADRD